MLGVMWFDATTHRLQSFTPDSIRHEAQQQDKLTSYGWLRHDGRSYGRQQLIDGDFNITLQMVRRGGADCQQVPPAAGTSLCCSCSYLLLGSS
jgi:mannosyl-oligosaccharide glucosidase